MAIQTPERTILLRKRTTLNRATLAKIHNQEEVGWYTRQDHCLLVAIEEAIAFRLWPG